MTDPSPLAPIDNLIAAADALLDHADADVVADLERVRQADAHREAFVAALPPDEQTFWHGLFREGTREYVTGAEAVRQAQEILDDKRQGNAAA